MDGTDTIIAWGRLRTAILALLAIGVAPALRAAGPKIAFDIPAGEVSQAIIAFYKQTNVEILYASPGGVGGVKTHAVLGKLEVSEALARMLEGTGFTFEFENAHSVLLKRAGGESAAVEVAPALGSGLADFGDGELMLAQVTSEDAPQLQDVVVTGTFIHGVLDIMSPLVHVTKKEMTSTAYATVQDALQSLTINSGGGFSDDFAGGTGNYNRGTAANLRGLGYGSTLVLINGRRQPLAGSAADFVDLSNIPWNAVERIEVLPDGASALYGSDAIAGVVNVVMRDELDGAETQARLASSPGGGGDEKVFAQMFGSHWSTGKWLASYQYSERSALAASDRRYTASTDKRPLGGNDHRSPWGNPGNIIDRETYEPILAIPLGQDGTSLVRADLLPGVVNLHNDFASYDLTPQRQMHNMIVNGSQELGERFELYAEGRLSERRATQRVFQLNQVLQVPSTNPFYVDAYGDGSDALVAYTFEDDLGPVTFRGKTLSFDTAVGLKAELGRSWHANLLASYGREHLRWTESNLPDMEAVDAALRDENPATAFNPFGDGSFNNPATLDTIRSTARSQITSDIRVASFVADGALFDLPMGAIKVAAGAEARQENLHQQLSDSPSARYGRDIASVFAEFSLPLMGTLDDPSSLPRLELSLAGRYEKYSDFGNTFNPKFGLRWVPVEWAKLRTSWGTSFKAPKLLDLYDNSQNAAGPAVMEDPRSPIGFSWVLIKQGNNPDLKQETAATWTAGIDLIPSSLPGLAVSFTYYDIDYEDRILYPGPANPFEILLQEAQWTDAIIRDPTAQQIADVCEDPGKFPITPAQCRATAPAAIVDFRMRNLAITKTRGIDLKLDYALNTTLGAFAFRLAGNRAFAFEQALSRTSPENDVSDTVGNPLSFRIRASVDWEQHGRNIDGFNAGATVDHTGNYWDVSSSLRRPVDSFTTLDLRFGYRGKDGGLLDGTELVLNVINILDETPPFIDSNFGYDVQNYDPTGRIVAFYVQKSW